MDRNPLTTPATAANSLLQDLEGAVVDSRASASLVGIVIEDILSSDHPTMQAPEGRRLLLLDETTIEALNHALTDVILNTRKAVAAVDAFYVAKRERA